MNCKYNIKYGGSSLNRTICKSCGNIWLDYRSGSADWEPRDCHSCEAKKFVKNIKKQKTRKK